jgi:broad specificity phosphatase PhoE
MSGQDALTPRVFLFRHGKLLRLTSKINRLLTIRVLQIGETYWAKLGRSTGITEVELNQAGAAQVSSVAATVVGVGKLLDPDRLIHVFVSPRLRTRETFELLLAASSGVVAGEVTYTEDIAEWNYGEYEGLTTQQIRESRKKSGLEGKWDIFLDGCEGGEYILPWSGRC